MVIVVGCGFLGSYLLRSLSANTKEPLAATVRTADHFLPAENVTWIRCDVTRRSDLERLAEQCSGKPNTVFYLAASHNVDHVFLDPEAARKINVEALETFLEVMPDIDRLFFASTDCVYGESSKALPAFSETSAARPLNEYGRQKLEAEQIVRSRGFTVLRFPLLMGPSLLPYKQHFYDKVCEKLSAHQEIEMIDGLRRSMLSYQTAAELAVRLAGLPKDRLAPVFNVCGDESFTKYEIGCTLAEKLGVPKTLVRRITEEEGAKFFKDVRASSTIMDNTLLKKTLRLSSVPWI